ncbi:MAG TPA: FMN-binding negative transcriptional regulator [Stellaceae bacterium]|nr:FMN-binding negative transcriptional regulator [Stellaceae bacterium]
MYVPTNFAEERVPVLHETIRAIKLGTLVTLGGEDMTASHVPMLVDPEPAPYGTLIGHIARANPQWKDASDKVRALAIFLGPDAYITPSWYATKRQTGKVVPTWNYAAIHAYGRVRFIEDPERLLQIVTRLTDTHEGNRAMPWAVTDAPADYVKGMLRAIVGFEIQIERLEGKWKMSQNRPAEDRAGVIEGLRSDGETTVADIVVERNPS